MNRLLEQEYFHNTVLDYVMALGIIVLGFAFIRLLKSYFISRLAKWSSTTKRSSDDFVISSLQRFGIPALYYLVIYTGLNYLTLSLKAARIIEVATSVVITYFIVRLLSSIILVLLKTKIRKQEHGEEKLNQLGGLMIIINIIIWIMGMVFLIDNLGYDVTTIIAGLGIGGIAVALAAQNILGDLFNYFVIFFDRPFVVGDFIIVGDMLGTIEYIGIKTTRIRSLSGEEIVIGNSNLTTSRIHNYKKLHKRRVVFTIDVRQGTEIKLLKEIPPMLKAAVEAQENVTFDRAHFAKYADWSLRFEIVYYVLSGDYNIYMDIQQRINFRIYEEFNRLGIHFARPTHNVYFNSSAKNEIEDDPFIEEGIENNKQPRSSN